MVNCGRLAAIGFLFAAAAVAQTSSVGALPRTSDGHPDFQGIWNNSSLTPLERGIALGADGKPIPPPPVTTLTIADNEAIAYEQRLRARIEFKNGDGSEGDLSGERNTTFFS